MCLHLAVGPFSVGQPQHAPVMSSVLQFRHIHRLQTLSFRISDKHVARRYIDVLLQPNSIFCTNPQSKRCLAVLLMDLMSPDGKPSEAVRETRQEPCDHD